MLLVHDPRNKFLIRNIYSKLIYVNNLSDSTACLPFTVTPTAVPEPLLWLSSSTRGICTYTLPGVLHVRIEMHTVHTASVVYVRISIIRPGDIRTTCQSHEYVHATSLCSSLHKCVHMHPNHLTLPPLDCSTVTVKAPLGETSGLCSLAVPSV